MNMLLGNTSRVREIPPPRQFEVYTGRKYLRNLEPGDTREWRERATFTLDEATGQVTIQSEYGDYAYRWTAIGDSTLADFLCSLDMDYFMEKAAGNWREIDVDATLADLKQQIIDWRRHSIGGKGAKDKARAAWNEVCEIDVDEIGGVKGFYRVFNDLIELPDIVEAYDLTVSTRPKATAIHFWNVVFKAFKDHVRELKSTEQPQLKIAGT